MEAVISPKIVYSDNRIMCNERTHGTSSVGLSKSTRVPRSTVTKIRNKPRELAPWVSSAGNGEQTRSPVWRTARVADTLIPWLVSNSKKITKIYPGGVKAVDAIDLHIADRGNSSCSSGRRDAEKPPRSA